MSRYIGFLVVSRRNGYLLEGRDHAARIFDGQAAARRACKVLQDQIPVGLPYEHLVASLIKGSAFCFETGSAYESFIKQLRNDPAHKSFMQYSLDKNFIRWRHSSGNLYEETVARAGVAAQPRAKAVPAGKTSVEAPAFNPSILVR